MNRRRLFFDIETSFAVCGVFKVGRKISVNYQQILEESAIICICYKWEDQKKIYSLKWDKNKNDKSVLKSFLKVAEQADELVAHNGDNFDLKYIRTRCYYHQVPMMPQYTTIDTFKETNNFRFQSRSLDYVSKFGGGTGKTHTDFELWKGCHFKDPKSLKLMVDYCKKDVTELEEVFKRLYPYMKHKSSVTTDRGKCPGCGSDDVIICKRRITAAGTRQVQYRCQNCGKFHTLPELAFNRARK